MAAGRNKKKPAHRSVGRTAAAASAAAAAPAEPPRRDLRPYIYFGINQLFVVIYFYVLKYVIPNRLMSATIHLWALPVLADYARERGFSATGSTK